MHDLNILLDLIGKDQLVCICLRLSEYNGLPRVPCIYTYYILLVNLCTYVDQLGLLDDCGMDS